MRRLLFFLFPSALGRGGRPLCFRQRLRRRHLRHRLRRRPLRHLRNHRLHMRPRTTKIFDRSASRSQSFLLSVTHTHPASSAATCAKGHPTPDGHAVQAEVAGRATAGARARARPRWRETTPMVARGGGGRGAGVRRRGLAVGRRRRHAAALPTRRLSLRREREARGARGRALHSGGALQWQAQRTG